MESSHALMVGMFWGGLLVAAIPLTLALAVGFLVLRRHLESRRTGEGVED